MAMKQVTGHSFHACACMHASAEGTSTHVTHYPCSKGFSPVPPPMLQSSLPRPYSPYQRVTPQPSEESAPSASASCGNPLLGDWSVYKRAAVSGWEVLL